MLHLLLSSAVPGPTPEPSTGKKMPRLHGYSTTTSLLRCIGGLTVGASATAMLILALDLNYQPLSLPPTSAPLPAVRNDDEVILYERIEDVQRKGAATVISDASLQRFLTTPTPQPSQEPF